MKEDPLGPARGAEGDVMQLGWHFCAVNEGQPMLRDGTLLEIGREYVYEGDLKMCESGYHDSERVIDALLYSPGSYLCRVRVSGDLRRDDKRCSRRRIALVGQDVTRELRIFAARIAYCALMSERERGRGREPDPRSWQAVRVAIDYAEGRASDEELSAAWSAAWSAAESAAWSAESAAWSAAWGAWSAARSAASAARSAARSAAWIAANALFLDTLPDALTQEVT